MWKIKPSGLYREISNAFDLFVDDFLEWIVTEKPDTKDQLEVRIRNANTPLCRVMVENEKLQEFAIELVQNSKRYQVALAYYMLLEEYSNIVDGDIPIPKCPTRIAKECFEYFYNHLVDNESFRKVYIPKFDTKIKKIYRAEFGRSIYSCPYCDLKDIPYEADSSTDHFLTKSKVPLLAISSLNLIVACTACNDRLKNQTMVFPMIHPFYHQAADHIKLRFMLVCPPHSINIAINAPSVFEQVRLENYSQMFKLNEQYTERVGKILGERQDIRREVVDSYKEVRTSKHIDFLRVGRILDRVIESRYLHKRKMKGYNEFSKLYLEYYEHLKLPINRKRLLNFIISELRFA